MLHDVKAAVTAKLLANVAQSGHPSAAEHVERILAGGATADLPPDSAGFTALALACRVGDAGVARVLLAHGADPHKATRDKGNPPLFWAAAGGHTAVIEVLLSADADPEQRNSGGDTALLWACRSGCVGASELLLRYRPTVGRAVNDRGMTALICAAAGSHHAVLQLLLANEESRRMLDAADEHGRTALHFAAVGSAACVQALLDAGADCSLRTLEGLTAQSEARAEKQDECERLLARAWEQQPARQQIEQQRQQPVSQEPLPQPRRAGVAAPSGEVGRKQKLPARQRRRGTQAARAAVGERAAPGQAGSRERQPHKEGELGEQEGKQEEEGQGGAKEGETSQLESDQTIYVVSLTHRAPGLAAQPTCASGRRSTRCSR